MSAEEKEKLLGPTRQATRYPVFKDAKSFWSYDYAGEERKRFKATPMWIPNPQLNDKDLDAYLKRVAFLWPPRTGMNEPIALRILMLSDYDVRRALALLETSNMHSSYEIVQMINQMTSSDAKVEMIGYLCKLSEFGLDQQSFNEK